MTFVKTWASLTPNVVPNDLSSLLGVCRAYMWQDTQFMLANGWATYSSNNWGSQAALTWAAPGSAHSWIVLYKDGINPGTAGDYGSTGRMYRGIDLNNANPYMASFSYHNAAPTGGTTTAAPTSTQQWLWTGLQFIRSTLNVNTLFHFGITSEGAGYSAVGYNGAGWVPFVNMIFPTSNPMVVDATSLPIPWTAPGYVAWGDSGNGAFASSTVTSNSGKCWAYDGTFTTAGLALMIPSRSNLTAIYGGNMPLSGAGPVNGESVRGGGFFVSTALGKEHDIADVADIYFSAQGGTQGKLDRATKTWCRVGEFWLPTAYNTPFLL